MIANDLFEEDEEVNILENSPKQNGKKQENGVSSVNENSENQSNQNEEQIAQNIVKKPDIFTQGIKFLTKKQREELQSKKEEQQQKQESQKQKQTDKVREDYDKFKLKEWKRKKEKEERRQKRKQEEERRKQRSQSRSRSRSNSREDLEEQIYVTSNSRARIPVNLTDTDNKETMAIKMQYLGLKAEKKRQLKPSEKFKNIFNFTWDKGDDTSADFNPLYKKKIDSNLLFGRGIKAGFDVTEQKAHSVNYEQLVHKYDINYLPKNKEKTDNKEEGKKKKDIYDLGERDHWSKKKNSQMNERDWRIFREDNNIVIKGGKVPIPMRNWIEFPLPQFIHDSIKRLKYSTPTPIQMQAVPIGMQRKDMIGVAPTGSGKSCAYLIPLICYLKTLPPIDYERAQDGPYALILLPARELAPQVEKEFENLTANLNIRSFVVVGGRSQEEQQFQISKGVELIIGTPGRIKDALVNKYLVFEQCSWVVLDEADKMIDMGFEPDVNFILDSIKTQMKDRDDKVAEIQEQQSKTGEQVYRVTHLFSATFPEEVERIARKYMRSLCYISIGEIGEGKKNIDQRVEFIGEHGKKSRLQSVLSSFEPPIIIFVNEKKGVDILSKIVDKWGFRSIVYHGSKTQQQRESAVEGFKTKKYDILIATDLAGRGLHVEGVTLVINFDAPKNIQDFVHRTGRTGRAGKKGVAITFLTAHDEGIFYDLNEYLFKNNYPVPPELANHEASKQKPGTHENVPRRKQVVYAQ